MWMLDREQDSGSRGIWVSMLALGLASLSLIGQCVHMSGTSDLGSGTVVAADVNVNQELARIDGMRRTLEDLSGRVAALEARPERDLAAEKDRVTYVEQKLRLVDEALLRSLEAVDDLKHRVERVENAR